MRIITALLLALLCHLSHAQTYSLKIQSSGASTQNTANAYVDVSLVTTVPASSTVLFWNSNFVTNVDTGSGTNGWYSYSTVYYVSGVPPTMKVINPSDSSVVATIQILSGQTSSTPVRITSSNATGVVFRLADNTLIGSQWAGASGYYGVVAIGGGVAALTYVGNSACGGGIPIYQGRTGDTYKFAYGSSGCGYPSQSSMSLNATYLLGY